MVSELLRIGCAPVGMDRHHIVAGSDLDTCVRCEQGIWVSPSSRLVAAAHEGTVSYLCARCFFAVREIEPGQALPITEEQRVEMFNHVHRN